MPPRLGPSGSPRAIGALALIAAVACLGAVAYAAGRPDGRGAKDGAIAKGKRKHKHRPPHSPPRPRFIEAPGPTTIGSEAQFRFHLVPRPQPDPPQTGPDGSEPKAPRRFQCRLDSDGWSACSSPHIAVGLPPGAHAFAVRALDRRGSPGRAAHLSWQQVEPKPFSIEPQGTSEGMLPGDPPQPLPVRVVNPNSVPIEVTSLTVEIAEDPPGCPGNPNFELIPASLSPSAPLTVPASGSASLPSATVSAPAIALRNLPVNQNACQGTQVRLAFSGQAHG
jgi:hypothetical protein